MAPQVHPEVLWAQRSSASDVTRNYIYLTIAAPDVPQSDMKLDIQPTSLTFTGTSTTKKETYHVEIPFYDEIDVAESKINHTDRDVEMVLRKKELKQEFWPRLLKDKARVHWLKTDFDKWVDEDEQDPNADDDDYMSRMGGLGGDGGGFEGIDFSKFGGGPGGVPPADMPADFDDDEEPEDDDDDDDDDQVPALEDEKIHAESEPKAKSGMEEVE